MSEEMTYNNKCPKCGLPRMTVIDDATSTRGACQQCGYTFSETKDNSSKGKGALDSVFVYVKAYSPILIILAISLSLIGLFGLVLAVGGLDSTIATLHKDVNDAFNLVDDEIQSVTTNASSNRNLINAMDNRMDEIDDFDIECMKNDVNSLKGQVNVINNDIDGFSSKLNNFSTNISDMQSDVENISMGCSVDPTINVTVYKFSNQSNATVDRYNHVNISVSDDTTSEVTIKFKVPHTNITLMNWSGYEKPEVYQWTNGSYDDNIKLNWFVESDITYCLLNTTFQNTTYGSEYLLENDMEILVKTNNCYFTITDVWYI